MRPRRFNNSVGRAKEAGLVESVDVDAIDQSGNKTTAEPPGGARAVSTHILGIHTLVMYGITYYAIGAAAPMMARNFGVATSSVFIVLGAALVAHAMIAPQAGRAIDRHGAGRFLLIGTVVRVTGLLVLASASHVAVFFAALAVIQFMSVFTEYETAFAAAVEAHGEHARSSLSLITVWGGLASTVFWPLTSHLLGVTDWRTMFLVYSGIMAAVSIPVSLYIVARSKPRSAPITEVRTIAPGDTVATAPTATAHRSALFVPLVAGFSLVSIAMGIPVIMPNLLDGLGLGSTAVLAGLLFGPSQTAGRFFEFVFGRRTPPLSVAIAASALLPVAIAALLAGRDHVWGPVLFAILFGAGNGIGYVVRGTVVLSLFGPSGYASYLGRIARVRLLVSAATPIVLTVLLERFGAVAAFGFAAVAAMLGVGAFFVVHRLARHTA